MPLLRHVRFLKSVLLYSLTAFGGPQAHIAMMLKTFVHRTPYVTEEELLEIARTLVAAEPADLFGQTEFKVRELAHKIAAKAYERRLAQKKSATTPPA